jgi:FMN phosphatase YigB (HAD superfamily)
MGADGIASMKPIEAAIPWQAWVFDLDDTLLDTSGDLVPDSALKVCEFLVSRQATSSLANCLAQWSQWRFKKSGSELFKMLMTDMPELERETLAQQAYQIFRAPKLPAKLNLLPGAFELLSRAQSHLPLFLVTQGDIPTQIKKVEMLNIVSFFRHIYYVDPYAGESKLQAFKAILNQTRFTPESILSIGNRLDNEITLSKNVGMGTCFFRYGEHASEVPKTELEVPDLQITHLGELVAHLPAPKRKAAP